MTEQPWKMPNNPTDTFDGSLSTEWELEALFLHLSLYLLLFFIPSLSTHHMDKSRAHGNDQSSTAGASCGHVEDYEAAILAANAEYDVKKAFVQSLARTAASSEVLAKEHAHLNMLKRRHAELVKASRQVPCTLRRGWLAYPPRMDIPRDVRDPNFAVAFSVEDVEAAQSWMAKYGFVIFRDVISEEDCRATRNEIWSYLESKVPGFRRDDPETWRVLSETNTGRYYDAYGLPPDPVIVTRQLVRNRQNCNVIRAFKNILGDGILVSQDRWCLYRATQRGGVPTRNNLHLDLHPWRYLDGNTQIEDLRYEEGHDHEFSLEIPRSRAEDGPHIQGVLNLLDNLEEDGGTQLVPGFHNAFMEWKLELGKESEWLFKPGQHSNWLHPGNGGASFKFHEQDPIQALAHRIPLKQGSLLLWDQRCVHGSRPNCSSRVRMAQFIRAFRRAPLSKDRAVARACAIFRKLKAAQLLDEVSGSGMEVFGFHDLPDAMDMMQTGLSCLD
ncbi:unnamed protein product [Durusdinium trenchii]|uniref:Phytanoyl-CoA dioxygenase n=1 Tax=Durusdinium trenchii TaxID=1381693 RepID=A0ABP0PM80_9DINO